MNPMNGVEQIFRIYIKNIFIFNLLGIELVSDSVDVPNENAIDHNRIQLASSSSGTVSLDQIKYQYVPKSKSDLQVDTSDNETSAASATRDDDLSIEDLMAQMKQI